MTAASFSDGMPHAFLGFLLGIGFVVLWRALAKVTDDRRAAKALHDREMREIREALRQIDHQRKFGRPAPPVPPQSDSIRGGL